MSSRNDNPPPRRLRGVHKSLSEEIFYNLNNKLQEYLLELRAKKRK